MPTGREDTFRTALHLLAGARCREVILIVGGELKLTSQLDDAEDLAYASFRHRTPLLLSLAYHFAIAKKNHVF